MKNSDHIAYCGLNCKNCEAYLATVRNDDEALNNILNANKS